MMIRRMPNSIREKAQSTWEPRARGVKMRRRIRVISMALFVIWQQQDQGKE
jgi:hypothetical protein